MLTTIVTLLIYLVVLAVIGYLIIWVLQAIGITVPAKIIQLVGVLIVLLVILWLISGGFPALSLPRSP